MSSESPATNANILLTCEHGGNDVPSEYQHLFQDARHVLETHRGWDIGILPFAEQMARHLRAPLISSTVSRLLVELNRSLGHPQLFSEFSERLPKGARQELLEKYYYPHRDQVGPARAAGPTGPVPAASHMVLGRSLLRRRGLLLRLEHQEDRSQTLADANGCARSFGMVWE